MITSSSIALLYAARALRGFGDGFAIILLPVYLSALGYGPAEIGIVATAALLGSAATTLGVGVLARRYPLRNLLLLGAMLMAATGVALPAFELIAVIAVVAFIGTINPSSGDIGLLIPLEHAALAQGVSAGKRTQTFARYSLIGAMATAAGSLAAAAPQFLAARGMDQIVAIKLMFYGYAALGLLAAVLYRFIPARPAAASATKPAVLGPSRGIVIKLAALFSIDSFAGGFVVQSLLALWLFERFELSLAQASVFFFWSNLLSAFSYPVAAWLSRRVGLINTMVFTHIPSSLCLIAAAFAPDLITALVLLLVRSALSQMDVPTRTSYVMSVVTPEEQAAAASFTAVPRTLASSISPAFAGMMLAGPFIGTPLVVCGVLKIAYDLALLYSFQHIKPPEEMDAALPRRTSA
ncbi:MAG: MFS transporter [Alphaproteobacteria bacterium]|nr:MAG: MFS transporter [Alphaproteobacteria bacterium]